MSRNTTFLPVVKKGDVTHLRVEVYYSLGGYNLFTYKQEPRGYYLSVSPVGRSERGGVVMESYQAFSGTKQLILPVNRQSGKRMEEALRLAEELKETLIAHVLQDNDLRLAS